MMFGVLVACAGLLITYGAHRRWDWLVDPSESLWFFYTQSFLKLIVGKTGLLVLTYAQGVVFFFKGLYMVAEASI